MADDIEMDEFHAAGEIGQKILEAAARLEPIDRVTPGAMARYNFGMDGVTYGVVVTVVSRENETGAKPA